MFKRKGIWFIPVTIWGWLIFVAAVVYAVYNAFLLNRSQHSVSDFLMNLVFRLLIVVAVYSFIAYLTLTKKP